MSTKNNRKLLEENVCTIDKTACMFKECDECAIVTSGTITYNSWIQVKIKNEEGTSSRTCLESFEELFDDIVNGLTDDH